jgi:hypothetical protein
MLNIYQKTFFVYRFYKILEIEPTTEVKAESIRAPSVKEIGFIVVIFHFYTQFCNCLLDYDYVLHIVNFTILYLLYFWYMQNVIVLLKQYAFKGMS